MSVDRSPQVSVVIPVFNAERYLNQCVRSILDQTMENLEVILINDGSTDNSKTICDAFASSDSRVITLHLENQGVSNARNTGMDYAKGEFVMFLDSDDWVDHSTCQTTYEFAIKNQSDIVFWSWQKVSPNGNVKELYLERNASILLNNEVDKLRVRSIGLLDGELVDPTKTDAFSTPWAKLYNRKFIVQSKVRFVERRKVGMEDVLFNIEIFQHAQRVGYIPAYFNFYRLDNPNSLTKVDTKSLYEKLTNLFTAVAKYASSDQSRQALNNRKIVSLINIVLSVTNPRSLTSLRQKWNDIDAILLATSKSVRWEEFPFHRLPFHWKLFFQFARLKQTTLLLCLVYIIRVVR